VPPGKVEIEPRCASTLPCKSASSASFATCSSGRPWPSSTRCPWASGAGWGSRLGALAFLVAGKERRKALASLARAFPEKPEAERHALGARLLPPPLRRRLEVGCTASLDRHLEALVAWPEADRRVLEAALARGRGVVFVSGHCRQLGSCWRGGWRGRATPRRASPRRRRTRASRSWWGASGRAAGCAASGAARRARRGPCCAPQGGEILGLLIDQDTRVQSLFVPFFGALAATPRRRRTSPCAPGRPWWWASASARERATASGWRRCRCPRAWSARRPPWPSRGPLGAD